MDTDLDTIVCEFARSGGSGAGFVILMGLLIVARAVPQPAGPGIFTRRVTSCSGPARRASRITGTSPAESNRLGSSKVTTVLGIWDGSTWRMGFLGVGSGD